MRILHVITKRQLRGAEIFTSQISAEFIRHGHEVIIVALYPPDTKTKPQQSFRE